jgi:xanthine dehydrogenase molybdopterin-binding subunit B
MSHAKNLHFGGAQTFQIEARVGVAVQSANWALYVVAVIYSPCFVSVQVMLSSMLGMQYRRRDEVPKGGELK